MSPYKYSQEEEDLLCTNWAIEINILPDLTICVFDISRYFQSSVHTILLLLACSRLRDSGQSVNCEKIPLVLFSRSLSYFHAVPTIWEPGTGYLLLVP